MHDDSCVCVVQRANDRRPKKSEIVYRNVENFKLFQLEEERIAELTEAVVVEVQLAKAGHRRERRRRKVVQTDACKEGYIYIDDQIFQYVGGTLRCFLRIYVTNYSCRVD